MPSAYAMGGRVSEVDDAYAWRLLRVRFTRPCALSLEAPVASYPPATRHLFFMCVELHFPPGAAADA